MRQTRVFAPRRPSTVCSHLTVAHALSVPCRHSCRHVLAATDEKSGLAVLGNRANREQVRKITAGSGLRTRGQTGLAANFRQNAPEIHASLVSPGGARGWR